MSSTSVPMIGGVNGERGGIDDLPSIDPALFTAPTETWSRFAAFLATTNHTVLISGGLGYRIDKLGGTAYRTPMFVNS